MISILVGLLAILAAIVLLLRKSEPDGADANPRFSGPVQKLSGAVLMIVGLVFLASSSFVLIGADYVGHLKRIYGFADLPPGHIIALNSQKGPQANILGPGFHFIPFVRVLYDVEEYQIVSIPEGFYGQITTLDGAPLPAGVFIAPQFAESDVNDMLNADTFLKNGGMRGPQETVLKPGNYRLNRYLFDVTLSEATRATIIPAGHVGVVKSNVAKPDIDCTAINRSAARASEGLTVPLVPNGCVGIWQEPLLPGAYYLNRKAYEVTLVDTRVQTWEYKGGFTKRIIDLSVDQQGNIQQTVREVQERVPDDAADRAVFVKVEGWDIPLELRALVQVDPENAPIVVGSVGGLAEIEDRILTPAIRSIVRNVLGSNIRIAIKGEAVGAYEERPTRVLDLIENREALEENIERLIKSEGNKAGVNIREIRLGEPAIPPELLISRLRVQLADQLSQAYERETAAQVKRVETEQARSTANEQPRLVAAQIAVQIANQKEQERAALGRAERQFLEQLAAGQKAQALVLGEDRVALLQALEKILATLEAKPELASFISKLVPNTVVSGGGDGAGLAGAAAILGQSLQGSLPQRALPAD